MSKKNRSLTELNDNLDEDLGWRKMELSALKQIIPTKQSNPKQRSFIRASIAMLYAHFEGFTKVACSHYADYVKLKSIKLNELKSCFIARITHQIGKSKNDLESNIEKIDFILEHLEQDTYNRDIDIDTKSNLNPEVLDEIFVSIGLEVADLVQEIKLENGSIDLSTFKIEITKLLKNRNEIAHGEYSNFISYDSFIQTYDIIIAFLDGLKNYLYMSASQEKYKR